ncbi:MAG: sigma-70 family RNA polymerase sigma factor [Acidobacteriota bacterium]
MTAASDEVAGLVRRAQAGDREALAALYRRFAGMVHGVVLAHARYHDVDDLAQEVFLHAMERLGSLRDPAAFGGWLAAIARTRALDHVRRTPATEPLADDVQGGIADDSEAVWILAAIRELPVAYRETLMLRLVEGMTGPEIAARTGLTPASVRVNLCRGMSQLRARLGRRTS